MSEEVWDISTDSPEATLALGAQIARHLHGGLVVSLVGPLGAGKTLLVKGIAIENAGEDCEVTSPTFTLVQEYTGRLRIYHLDVYRLKGPNDPLLRGLDEMAGPNTVALIEWGDRVAPILPDDTLWIEIKPLGPQCRKFEFRATGQGSQAFLANFAIESQRVNNT